MRDLWAELKQGKEEENEEEEERFYLWANWVTGWV